MTAIHLHSNKTAELEANGNIQSVYIFGAIAAFILLIACVNSMNLSTARSANRAKEVGIRKVMGSLRSSLISQFMLESVLISFIAMLNYIRNRELGFTAAKDFLTDSTGVIVNEAAVRYMQGRNPLETKLYRIDDSKTKKTKEFHILGVIQEFNFNSLREVVTPMVLFLAQDQGTLALRVNGSANLHRLTGQIESEWRKMAPSQPF